PRVFAELALAWSRMEAPQLPPGPHIEGHHVRLRELHRFRIARVFERGRNDGDVAEHQRRRGVHQVPDGRIEVRVLFDLFGQIDNAVTPEGDVGVTGFRVQRDQLVARRHGEDLGLTAVRQVCDAGAVLVDAGCTRLGLFVP